MRGPTHRKARGLVCGIRFQAQPSLHVTGMFSLSLSLQEPNLRRDEDLCSHSEVKGKANFGSPFVPLGHVTMIPPAGVVKKGCVQ